MRAHKLPTPRVQAMTHTELIQRLEQASGPDRELGDAVLLACGWTRSQRSKWNSARQKVGDGTLARDWFWVSPSGYEIEGHRRPDPTASLDAALTLVPEGAYGVCIDQYIVSTKPHPLKWRVWMKHYETLAGDDDVTEIHTHYGTAPNPALALTIASLKARDSLKGAG